MTPSYPTPLDKFVCACMWQVMCEACGEVVHSGGTLYTLSGWVQVPGRHTGCLWSWGHLWAVQPWVIHHYLSHPAVESAVSVHPLSPYDLRLTGGVSNGAPGNASNVVCHACGPGSDCSAGDGQVTAAKGFWGASE